MTQILEKLEFGESTTTRFLIQWPLLMTVSQSKANIYSINHDLVQMGVRITGVDFGKTLYINGHKVDNLLKNKMVLTVEKGLPFGERAMSNKIFSRFIEFLKNKVTSDPVEDHATSITE